MLAANGLLFACGTRKRKDSFFLESANRLRRQDHCDFLAVYHERFLLKIRFENAFRAAQREAHIVAKLFAFAGQFTSCCHFLIPLRFNNLYQYTVYESLRQVVKQ